MFILDIYICSVHIESKILLTFKITYTIKGKDYEIYGYVRYKDLKLSSDNIVLTDFSGYTYLPMYKVSSYVYLNGYDSEEESDNCCKYQCK